MAGLGLGFAQYFVDKQETVSEQQVKKLEEQRVEQRQIAAEQRRIEQLRDQYKWEQKQKRIYEYEEASKKHEQYAAMLKSGNPALQRKALAGLGYDIEDPMLQEELTKGMDLTSIIESTRPATPAGVTVARKGNRLVEANTPTEFGGYSNQDWIAKQILAGPAPEEVPKEPLKYTGKFRRKSDWEVVETNVGEGLMVLRNPYTDEIQQVPLGAGTGEEDFSWSARRKALGLKAGEIPYITPAGAIAVAKQSDWNKEYEIAMGRGDNPIERRQWKDDPANAPLVRVIEEKGGLTPEQFFAYKGSLDHMTPEEIEARLGKAFIEQQQKVEASVTPTTIPVLTKEQVSGLSEEQYATIVKERPYLIPEHLRKETTAVRAASPSVLETTSTVDMEDTVTDLSRGSIKEMQDEIDMLRKKKGKTVSETNRLLELETKLRDTTAYRESKIDKSITASSSLGREFGTAVGEPDYHEQLAELDRQYELATTNKEKDRIAAKRNLLVRNHYRQLGE